MDIRVLHGDALKISADVLVLKYAQAGYGVDKIVVALLEASGRSVRNALPKPGGYKLVETEGLLAAKTVLFVGVVALDAFGYEAIREFSKRALSSLAQMMPAVSHVAFTLHGAQYGLDEAEAFRAELAGIFDAIKGRSCPDAMTDVTIIERDKGRVQRLRDLLDSILPMPVTTRGRDVMAHETDQLWTAGASSKSKPHVFVAMPFSSEFDDRYHYGIRQAVQAVYGQQCLCERADLATFTGDILIWVKERIASARLIVADLSTANPNVYLEVGYAWGKGVPVVLVVQDAADLRFDVKGQRCIVYNNAIRKLEEALKRELSILLK